MDKVPGIKISQPCHGVDMFYVLPNVLVGSYPSEQTSMGKIKGEGSLRKILEFLSETYKKSLVINLVAEQKTYKIDEKFSSAVSCKWVHWIDHHPLALSDFVNLIYSIVKFLQVKSHAVFIHCKHGKGRTGTLVCALITYLYGVSLDDAFEIFVQRRAIYEVGVKIESQIRLLHYWNDILENQKVKLAYTQIKDETTAWFLRKMQLKKASGIQKGKKFNLRIANIHEKTKESGLQFESLGEIKVGQEYFCRHMVMENVSIVLEHRKFISKSFVTFSVNNAMESVYLKKAGTKLVKITMNWNEMDGINGTGFKGKRYFDTVCVWIEQVSK